MFAPHQFPLQVPRRIREPFEGDDWLFEVKHDGFRVLALRDDGVPRLYTRNGYNISRPHHHITAALAAIPAERFVLDGELVVLDDNGRSNFAKLARGRTGTDYFAFDLLTLENADLRDKPVEARKAAVAELLHGCAGPVRYCDHVIAGGRDFFDTAREAGLEGMVAKRRRSQYAARSITTG